MATLNGDLIQALADAQSALSRRFDTLERVVRSLRVNRLEEPAAARLSKLQEAVSDLAVAQHDVRRQLDALTGAVECLADEHLADGGLDSQGAAPDYQLPATFVPSDAARGWRPRLKRRARVVLRSTLGKLRQVWDAAHPRPPWGGEVRLVVKDRPPRQPTLTIVAQADHRDADPIAGIEAALERQADRDFVRRIQDRGSGAAIDTDYVWLAGPLLRRGAGGRGLGDLAPTFLETARLLLATEELGFVYFEEGGVWIVSSDLWHAEGHVDGRALRRRAKRHPGRVLGKVVDAGGDHDLLPRALCRPGIRRHVRRSGAYVVPVATKPRIVTLHLRPPRPEPRPAQALIEDIGEPVGGRPAVLLLLTTALTGGLERLVAAMLEDLGRDTRPVVVTMVPQTSWSAHRLRALERLTPYVYALDGVFAEQLQAGVVQELIVRHDVHRLMQAGGNQPWPALRGSLRRRFPELRIVDLDLTGTGERYAAARHVSCHLAAGAAAEQALTARGVAADRILRLPPVADFEPAATTAGAGERLRAEYGWGTGILLVVNCGDLVAEQRPEDFVALAHRLRDDRRFRFLLVGDGPLSADLMDLKRLFGLLNLRLERPERTLGEILDAADVVCTTAESDPFPDSVIAALRRRRPVVAAAIGDLPRLLAAGPCGLTVPYPGDLDGFEEALRSLAADELRRELGDRGPKAAGELRGDDGGAAGSPRRGASEIWRRALDLPPASAEQASGRGGDGSPRGGANAT